MNPALLTPNTSRGAIDQFAPGGASSTRCAACAKAGRRGSWRVHRDDTERTAVLRVGGDSGDDDGIRTEWSALELAAREGIPVAPVIAGRGEWRRRRLPPDRVHRREQRHPDRSARPAGLRTLGAAAARIHPHPPWSPDSRRRTSSIGSVDFGGPASCRTAAAPCCSRPKRVRRAPARPRQPPTVSCRATSGRGNTLWAGDGLAAIIDWDCSGRRNRQAWTLGSLRCDAALLVRRRSLHRRARRLAR